MSPLPPRLRHHFEGHRLEQHHIPRVHGRRRELTGPAPLSSPSRLLHRRAVGVGRLRRWRRQRAGRPLCLPARRGQRRPQGHQHRLLGPLRAQRRWQWRCGGRPASLDLDIVQQRTGRGEADGERALRTTPCAPRSPACRQARRSTTGSRQDATSARSATRRRHRRASTAAALRFAWLTCQDWSVNHWGAMSLLAAEDLDFLVHVGDYVYETVGASFQAGAAEPAHTAIKFPGGTKLADGTTYATTARRLPHALPHLPRRQPPAGPARQVAHGGDLGRPRVQRRLLAGPPDLHQPEQAGDGTPPRRQPGLGRVHAGRFRRRRLRHRQRGHHQHPHLSRFPLRQPHAPGDDRRAPLP